MACHMRSQPVSSQDETTFNQGAALGEGYTGDVVLLITGWSTLQLNIEVNDYSAYENQMFHYSDDGDSNHTYTANYNSLYYDVFEQHWDKHVLSNFDYYSQLPSDNLFY